MFKRCLRYLVNNPQVIAVLAMIVVTPVITACLWAAINGIAFLIAFFVYGPS